MAHFFYYISSVAHSDLPSVIQILIYPQWHTSVDSGTDSDLTSVAHIMIYLQWPTFWFILSGTYSDWPSVAHILIDPQWPTFWFILSSPYSDLPSVAHILVYPQWLTFWFTLGSPHSDLLSVAQIKIFSQSSTFQNFFPRWPIFHLFQFPLIGSILKFPLVHPHSIFFWMTHISIFPRWSIFQFSFCGSYNSDFPKMTYISYHMFCTIHQHLIFLQ